MYFVGIGSQAVVTAFLGQRLGIRPRLLAAISVCYLIGMVVGARVLFHLHQGTFSFTGLLDPDVQKQGLWGGPLVYVALAIPVVLAIMRRKKGSAESACPSSGHNRLSGVCLRFLPFFCLHPPTLV